MPQLEVSAGVPFTEDFDPDALLATIPTDYQRKGILFPRHARVLGDALHALPLESPPGPKGYDPLESYPARDYFRIFNLVAEQSFPGEKRAQQWRLLARREIDSLTATSLGRVEWSGLGDPLAALLRYQQFSPFVINKPRATATELRKNAVRIEYTDPVISIPYGVGVFEGVVMSFGMHPRITVDTAGELTTFDVRWGL